MSSVDAMWLMHALALSNPPLHSVDTHSVKCARFIALRD